MNLQKILPFEDYVLASQLTVAEVYKYLAENIEPKRAFRFSVFSRTATKPYEGEISGNIFTISRIISYRNSFLPVITGNVSSLAGETQIHIKMKPVILVIIFMSFWLGVLGLVCIGMFLTGLLQFKEILRSGFSPMNLIPFGMFGFGWALIYFGFKAESKKSKAFLATLLNGREIA
jgi:hypothetical protein